MDRKEAIEYAKFRLECHTKGDGEYTDYGEFLVAAIEALYKLQRYEDLEEQGRLIELPCAVEDIVYAADAEPIIPLMVSKIGVYLDGGYGGDWESLSSFGKTIFLTQEEAEAALKGVEK